MQMFVRNELNQIMRFPEKTPNNQTKSDKSKTGLKIKETGFSQKRARKRGQNTHNFGKVRITAKFENSEKL